MVPLFIRLIVSFEAGQHTDNTSDTSIKLFKLCYEITQDLSKDDVEINEERKEKH